MTRVDQVAAGIYRISSAARAFPLTVNQFLIEGEQPALIHTGGKQVVRPRQKRVKTASGGFTHAGGGSPSGSSSA